MTVKGATTLAEARELAASGWSAHRAFSSLCSAMVDRLDCTAWRAELAWRHRDKPELVLASLRERLGIERESLELPPGAGDLGALLDLLARLGDAARPTLVEATVDGDPAIREAALHGGAARSRQV